MKKTFASTLCLLLTFCLAGCASIVSKSNWPVTVQTNPTGAKCLISKASGASLQTGETPLTVTLSSSEGYFSKASYLVKCDKEGYLPAEAHLDARVNGWWYFGGNLIFGGLIGWFIVDPATGAMWRLDETLTVNLLAAPAK